MADVTYDNTRDSATLLSSLSSGTSFSVLGSLGSDDKVDWYKTAVTAPGRVTVKLSGLTGAANLVFWRLNGNGVLEEVGASSAILTGTDLVSYDATQPGDYYVQVVGDGTSADYTLELDLNVSSLPFATTVAIDPFSPLSGSEGGSPTFTVMRDGDLSAPTIVHWAIQFPDGQGQAVAADFAQVSGTVTFAAFESLAYVTLSLVSDGLYESNEDFRVVLTGSDNATVVGGSPGSTIYGDSGQPAARIEDFTPVALSGPPVVREGGSIVYRVALGAPPTVGGTVNWQLAGSATVDPGISAGDFVGGTYPSGVVTFLAGQTEAFVTINTAVDALAEEGEAFTIRLTGATGDVVIDHARNFREGAIVANGDLTPGGIAAGQVRRGTLSVPGEVDSYTLHLVGGRVYQFEANAAEADPSAGLPLDPFIELRDASGTVVVAMNNNMASTYGARVAYTPTADGDYTVLVKGNNNSAGSYVLQTRVRGVDDLPGGVNPSLFNGENLALAGWLEVPGSPVGSTTDTDTIGLRLRAGQQYSYWLMAPQDAAFHVDLRDSLGNLVAGGTATIGEAVTGYGNYALRQINLQVPGDGSYVDGTYFLKLTGEQAFANLRSYRLVGGAVDAVAGVSPPSEGIFIQPMGAYAMEGGVGTSSDYVFAIMRSGTIDAPASVNWSASAFGTSASAASIDFSGSTFPVGGVSFAAGESIKFITLGIAGDGLAEADEYFQVALSTPSGGVLVGGLETAVGRIVSGDPLATTGKAIFSASTVDAYKAEGSGGNNTTQVFRINRSDVTTTAVAVNWQLRNDNVWGTFATADDFVGTTGSAMPSGTVSFAANETFKFVTVTIAGDSALEYGEGYSFNLSLPSGAANASIESSGASTFAGIRNDDGSRVLVSAMGRPTEGGVSGFRVTRTNGSVALNVNETFTWRVATTGLAGSTVSAEDFVGNVLPSGTIGFGPGQTVATLSLATSVDFLADDNEAFRIEVFDGNGVLVNLPEPSPTSFTVSDVTNVGTLGFGSFSNVAAVSDSFAGTGESFDDFRVHLADNGHLRVGFASLTGVGDIDLQLLKEEMWGTEVVAEGDLSLVANNLTGNTDYIVRAINRSGTHDYGLNISLAPESDPSVAPTIWFDQFNTAYPVSWVDEDFGAGPLILPVLRQGGDLSSTSVVSWLVERNPWGTSVAAEDFGTGTDTTFPAGDVTFAAGQTLALVTLNIFNDGVAEGSEQFRVRLTASDYGNLAQGQMHNGQWRDATLWSGINPSDTAFGASRPWVNISPARGWSPVRQFEADAGGMTSYVFRIDLGGQSLSAGSASVQWAVDLADSDTGVTATDFAGGVVPRGEVVFYAGGPTAAFVTVQVAGDAQPESQEWFSVRLTGADAALQIGGGWADGVILNNDDEFLATTATTAVIGAGGVMVGDIGPAGDKDWVRVDLVAGKSYNFEAHSTDGGDYYDNEVSPLDPFLVLRDATGAALAMSNDFAGSNGPRINYVATATGSYYLEVSGNPAKLPTTGEYIVQSRLTATDDYRSDAGSVGFLSLSQPVAMGWFESAGDRDWFRINLRPNESGNLAIETAADVDLTLRLVDANGNEIAGAVTRQHGGVSAGGGVSASGSDGYARHEFGIQLGSAPAGEYFLEVQGTQAQGYLRSYRISESSMDDDSEVERQANNVLSLTMADAFKSEGANNAATPYVFTIHRDGDLNDSLAVTAMVVPPPMGSLTAADSSDFFGADDLFAGGRQVVFAAGQSTAAVTLNIRGDASAETDEYFALNVWAPPPAGIDQTVWNSNGYSMVGRIKSDDSTIASAGSVVSVISPADFTEGSQGARPYVFTLLRDGDTTAAGTVDWSVFSAPFAGAGLADFAGNPSLAPAGSVSFAAGATAATVTVSINGDTLAENDEYFSLFLSNPSAGIVLANSLVTGRIRDDDSNFISVGQVSGMLAEGDSGTSPYLFYVFREGASAQAATVQWNVSRMPSSFALGSVAADDFQNGLLPSGTISFAAGQDYAVVTVAVTGDANVEGDEYFQFNLANASAGWSLGNASVTGRIANDDSSSATAASIFSITTSDAYKAEGSGTNTTQVFRVNRALTGTGTAGVTSSVHWAARNDNLRGGTNIADATDFVGGTSLLPSGDITFTGTETVKFITLTIAADTLVEPGEGYSITISNALSAQGSIGITASIAADTSFAGIYNDDGSSTFTFAGGALGFEGEQNQEMPTLIPVVITRSGGNNSQWEWVNWQVLTSGAPGAADANDFAGGGMMGNILSPTAETLPGGSVAFMPGSATATIFVSPANDGMAEGPETFQVQLRRGSGTPLASTTVTLLDGAAPSGGAPETIAIVPMGATDGGEVRRVEGGSVVYTVMRTGGFGSLNTAKVVDWDVSNLGWGGIATAADFGGSLPSGHLTFAATSATVQTLSFTVNIANDTLAEDDEWFNVELFASAGGTWLGSVNTTILDNDDEFGNTTATASRLGILGNTFGGIDSAGDDDWFKVSLSAGLDYRFIIGSPQATLLPNLRLLNSAGSVVGGASIDTLDGGGAQVLRYTPASSGDFYLSARGAAGQTGKYVLWTGVGGQDDAQSDSGVWSAIATSAQPIAVLSDADRLGMIDHDGDTDWYRVELQAGHNYQFSADHFNSLQLSFELYDSTHVLKQTFGSASVEGLLVSSEGEYTPTVDGSYYLRVAETGVGLGAGGYVVDVWDQDFEKSVFTGTPFSSPTQIVVGVDAVSGNIIEGGSGTTNQAVFRVVREGFTSNVTTVVDWQVQTTGIAGDAIDAGDFVGGTTALPGGTVTFAPGEVERFVTLSIAGDANPSELESFRFQLTDASNSFVGTQPYFGNPVGVVPSGNVSVDVVVHDLIPEYSIALESQYAWPDRSEGSSWVFRVSRSGRIDQAGSVDYQLQGTAVDRGWMTFATAASNDDIVGAAGAGNPASATLNLTGSVSFAAGETLRLVTITSMPDGRVEDNEGFRITLSAPLGATVAGTASIDLGIWNDDLVDDFAGQSRDTAGYLGSLGAGLTIGPQSEYVGNTGTTIDPVDYWRFTAGANGALALSLTGTGGAATFANLADIDVRLEDRNGNFLASSTWGGNVAETINFGGLVAGQDYYVAVYAYNGQSGYQLTLSNISAPTSLAVAALDAYKAEGNGGNTAYTFVVNRSGLTPAGGVVSWSVQGDAVNGADAADFGGSLPAGSFTFNAGESSRVITVNASGDLAAETLETFRFTIATGDAGVLVTQAQATGYLVNDDTADTGGDTAVAAADLGLLADAAQLAPVFGQVGDNDDVDWYKFTADANGVANIRLSGMSADADLFVYDSTGTTQIAASTFGGYTVDEVAASVTAGQTYFVKVDRWSGNTNYVLDIAHLAAARHYQIAAADAELVEGSGGVSTAFTFEVTRDGGGPAGSVGWRVQAPTLAYGQAAAADFIGGSLPSGVVSFAAGQTAAMVTIAVATDSDAFEGDETFAVTLFAPVGAGLDPEDPASWTATGTILAGATADLGANTRVIADFNFSQGWFGFAGGGVLAAGAPLTLSDEISVSGDPGDFYKFVAATSGQLTLDLTGLTADADVQVLNGAGAYLDGSYGVDSDEQVVLDVVAGQSYYVRVYPFAGSTSYNLSLSLVEDSTPDVWIEVGSGGPVRDEGGAHEFVVHRGTSGGALSVSYSVAAAVVGTEPNATDFGGSLPGGVVSFANGALLATITVASSQDNVVETDEAFRVTLAQDGGNAIALLAGRETAVGIIRNDDVNTTGYAISGPLPVPLAEGNGGSTDYVFTVTRSGNLAYAGEAVWSVPLPLSTAVGAANAADFGGTLPAGTLTIAAGLASATITVSVVGDGLFETDEFFSVGLSSVRNTGASVVPTASISVGSAGARIVNDDAAMMFSFDTGTVSSTEGSALEFTISRSGDTSAAASVGLGVTHLGTVATDLSGTLPAAISFAAGVASVTLTINTVDDVLAEADESFRLNLLTPSTGYLLNPQASAAYGVINASDLPAGNISAVTLDVAPDVWTPSGYNHPVYEIEESAGVRVVTVTRDADTGPDLVSWRIGAPGVNIADGFSEIGEADAKSQDFTAMSGYATFATGALTTTFTLPVVPGTSDEEADKWLNLVVGESWKTSAASTTVIAGGSAYVVPLLLRDTGDYDGSDVLLNGYTDEQVGRLHASDTDTYFFNSATALPPTMTAQVGVISAQMIDPRLSLYVNLSPAGTADTNQDGVAVVSYTGPGAGITASVDVSSASGTEGSYAVVARRAGYDESTGIATAATWTSDRTPYAGWLDAGDSDWLKVNLNAGVRYTFEAVAGAYQGAQGAQNARLSFGLYNAGTVLVAGDTDGGEPAVTTVTNGTPALSTNLDALFFDYTAATSGTYYLKLQGSDAADRLYVVAVNAPVTGAANQLPTVGISASQNETAENGADLVFALRRSGNLDFTSTVAFRLTGVTPTATTASVDNADLASLTSADGAGLSGIVLNTLSAVSFSIGQAVSYITVSAAADSLFELDEQFKIELLAAGSSNVVVPTTGNTLTATLRNDDAPPTLSITAPGAGSVVEGSAGTAATPGSTPFVFTVTRDQATARVSTTAWAVQAPSTVIAGDFVGATSGTVTFNAFQTEVLVTVNVKADYLPEDDEAFAVVLSTPTNALLDSNPSAVVTIVNDDALPSFSIAAAAAGQAEGNAGATAFVYTVSRSGNAQVASTVRWSVADDGDANLNLADFSPAATAFPNGVLSFAAGETVKTVTVSVAGDTLDSEGDERFRVVLAPVSSATIGDGVWVSNIYDDDHVSLNIAPSNTTLSEGTGALYTPFVFTLTRSGLSPDANVTSVFNWSVVTTGISTSLAADPEDFLGNVMPGGTVTFGQGVQVQTVTVNVQNDQLVEGAEAFKLAVTQATGTTGVYMGGVKNGTLTADASITDDDTASTAEFSIAALAADLQEGNTGNTAFTFRVTRTGNLTLAASLAYTLEPSNDSSISYADFGTGALRDLPYGRVTFAAGQTSQVITISVRGDTLQNEGDEFFSVSLTTPVNNLSAGGNSLIVIGDVDTAYGVIRDDDLSSPDYAGGMAHLDGLPYGFVINPRDLGEIGAVARVISGDRVGGLLATGGTDEQDVYRFHLATAGSLSLTLGGMTVNTDADLYLYSWEDDNDDGWIDENELTLVQSSFAGGNANEVIALPYMNAGEYVALVESYAGDTPYTLSLLSAAIADGAGNTPALARAITSLTAQTQSFTDFVGGADGHDYYKFTTTANTYFSLALTGLADDADVRLLNTSGQVVASSVNAGSTSESIQLESLAAGTYYVWVAPYGDAATFYNLSLSAETLETAANAYNSPAGARVVTLSSTAQTISDSVGRIDTQDYYKFTLTTPTRVELGLSSIAAQADVDLELLDAAGNRLAASATAGNANESIVASGLAAGTYYARVYSVTGASPYAISLKGTAVAQIDAGGNVGAPVTLGVLGDTLVTRSDYVGNSDTADLFRFSVGSGAKRLAVELTGMSGDLDVTILDADFNPVNGNYYWPADAGHETGPADEIFDLMLGQVPDGGAPLLPLQAGDYYLKITQGVSAINSSNYQLALSLQDDADADVDDPFKTDSRGIPEGGGYEITSLIATGATAQRVVIPGAGQSSYTDFVGSLDPDDYYRFTLDGLRNLRLTMTGMTANADVELLDADGAVAASSRKTGTQAESISLDNLAAGTYYVHVLRGTNNVNTRYSLNMTATAPTDTAGNTYNATTPAAKLLTLSSTPVSVSEYVGSLDDKDYYKFTLATAGTYTVSAALGNVVGTGNPGLRLLEANGSTEIAGAGGIYSVNNATAGAAYYIEVARGTAADELSYQLNAWAIGNNATDGAGRLLASATLPSFAAIDDSFAYTTTDLNTGATGPKVVTLTTAVQTFRDVVSWANDTTYDDDWYKVVLGNVTTGAGGRIVANLSGLVGDANLTLYGTGGATTFTALSSSTLGGTLNESIVSDNLAAGTYYLRVATAASASITGYTLDLKQVARDDYVASIEAMQAGGAVGTISLSGTDVDKSGSLAGAIELAGDADWFKVHLTAGAYSFTARGTAPTATAAALDTKILGIYNASGSLLADSQGDDSIRTTTTGTTTTSAYTTDAQVTLTIAEEGDYYISAAAYGALTGAYTMLVSSRNETPIVTNPIADQSAAEGSPFVLRLPWNVFRDPEGRPLTLSATLRDGSALPSWLTYDAAAQMFTGNVPVGADEYQIRLRATDPGFDNNAATSADNKFVDTTFTLRTPRVTDDFAASIATTGTVTVGGTRRGRVDATYDVDWIKVSLQAGQAYTINLRGVQGGGRLADPMLQGVYDAAGVLVPNTQNDDFGASLDSRVTFTARDTGNYFIAVTGAATSIGAYEVAVSQTTGVSGNEAPLFTAVPLWLDYADAIEGGTFNYVIPSGAFTDEQALTYTAKLSSGDALPTWLAFNATTRTFNATAVPTNINDLDIRVTATDIYGLSTAQDMVLRTKSPTEVQGTWTIMVYMAADNDLEQYALKDLNEMESVTLSNGVRLVVMVDRNAGYSTADLNWTDTRRGLIRQDNNLSSVTSLTTANSVGELDTGSPNTLTDFINWSASNYRAQNYGLVVWDHGGGLSGTSWDFTTTGRSNLSVAETTNAIATSILGRVDVLGFDTCLQGMAEQVVDVSGVADFTVASSDLEPGDGWDYSRWLSAFTASANPTDSQVATAAVTAYGTAYQNSETLAAVDSSRLGALVDRINDFVSATDALGAGNSAWNDLLAARVAPGVRNYNNNDYIDLGGYMDAVAADTDLATNLRNAASAVSLALDAAVIAQTQAPNASGLAVFLPGSDAAANAADYNASNFRFLADSRWSSYVQNLASNT